jgi:hypothetical protein
MPVSTRLLTTFKFVVAIVIVIASHFPTRHRHTSKPYQHHSDRPNTFGRPTLPNARHLDPSASAKIPKVF